MYCPNCGSPLNENGVCPNCGNSTAPYAPTPQAAPQQRNDSGLRMAAFVFFIITLVCVVLNALMSTMVVGIGLDYYGYNAMFSSMGAIGTFICCIIPLAWVIPMTVHANKVRTYQADNTIAFGVCSLIFCTLIGGILLLCANKDR